MEHRVRLTADSSDSMKSLDPALVKALYTNFIQPIKNGLQPYNPHQLPGKYKPSWESEFPKNAFSQFFINEARAKNVHHYHVGYKSYKNGQDKKYPGLVSAGIAHTRIYVVENVTDHVILELCVDHPSPFVYPYLKLDDEPLPLDQ
jgi:hypothetical protein